MNPRILREKICSLIENRDTYKKAMAEFRLSGLDMIQRRIDLFKRQHATMSVPRDVEAMTQTSTKLSPDYQGMAV